MKKVLSCILALSMLLLLPVSAAGKKGNLLISTRSPYGDLDAEWYRSAVEQYGYPDIFSDDSGRFYPNKEITRMEFARMLHKALNIRIYYFAATDIAEFFDDVKSADTGAGALYDLALLGIIDCGRSFRPDAPLTREEMTHFALKAVDYLTGGEYVLPMMMPAPFDDDAEIKDEYKNDVVKAVLLKLMNGRGGNRFCPRVGAKRAEAAVIIDRLVRVGKALAAGVEVTASAAEENGALLLTLTLSNNGKEPVTIRHNSGQKFDFKLFDKAGAVLYTWSADLMFTQALTETVIQPGDKAVFSAQIDAAQYAKLKGKIARIMGYVVGSSDEFVIQADGYSAAVR